MRLFARTVRPWSCHAKTGRNGLLTIGLILAAGALALAGCRRSTSSRQSILSQLEPVAPLLVVGITPANGSDDVGLGTQILIRMNHPVDPTSLHASSVRLTDEDPPAGSPSMVEGTITTEESDQVLRFTPKEPLQGPSHPYRIELDATILDVRGIPIDIDASRVPIPSHFMTTDGRPPFFFHPVKTAMALCQASVGLHWFPAIDNRTASGHLRYLVFWDTAPIIDPGTQDVRDDVPNAFLTPKGVVDFVAENLQPDTTYHFLIRAVDGAGNIDDNTLELTATTLPAPPDDTTPPTFAGQVEADPIAEDRLRVRWEAGADDTTLPENIVYDVFIATSSGGQDLDGPPAAQTFGQPGSPVSLKLGGLEPAVTYYIVVRAGDCSGNKTVNPNEATARTKASYAANIQPVLSASCTASTCHGAISPGGGLILTSYAFFARGGTSGPAFVPGSPDNSLIMRRIDETSPNHIAPRMPEDQDPLPAETIDVIARWIEEGARNN